MIILTDSLIDLGDEGCVNVAGNLVRRIKQLCPETTIITYDRESSWSDLHLAPGRFFIYGELLGLLRRRKEPVLYIPFSSNTKGAILRTWILSKLTGCRIHVLFALLWPMDGLSKRLLQDSGARVFCLSESAQEAYGAILGDKAVRLRAAVDTAKFQPADRKTKAAMREKYGIAPEKKVLLHVGHMKEERNLRQLLKVSGAYHILLVVSTLTVRERDEKLKNDLLNRPNTTVFEGYMEEIQELYQASDVYFFPVDRPGQCIDMPLSVLEAAACDVPVVAWPGPQLREFRGEPGFFFTDHFEADNLNALLDRACASTQPIRHTALAYDWNHAAANILAHCESDS